MLSSWITLLYLIDRLLRMLAIAHFFRQSEPSPPAQWPSLSLIQPITQGAAQLERNLRARFEQAYAGSVQHLLVCDEADAPSQMLCQRLLAEYPSSDASLVVVASAPDSTIASKIGKLNAGLALATGEIICCIDDDIEAHPDTLRHLVTYLQPAQVGAVFGLAAAVSWSNPWSSLMSLFVNSNALPTYIPLTYLSQPVAITGHLFALRAADLQRVGAWEQMEGRVDDDNDLGRRLIENHLRLVQTPVLYRVHNEFDSRQAYAAQIKRWFIIPRQSILPHLSQREKQLSGLLSLGLILPLLALLLAILRPGWQSWLNVLVVILLFGGSLEWIQRRYLHEHFPHSVWLLALITLFVTPLQALWAIFFAQPLVEWRGQRLRIERGGAFKKVKV